MEEGLFGAPPDPGIKGMMMDPRFREGVAALQKLGLTLDIWCLHTQLAELTDLADAFPDQTIILDHLGTPVLPKGGADDGTILAQWREAIREAAQRPNLLIKIGGLGMDLHSFGVPAEPRSSAELAADWRPYVEGCIEAFGPARCMFESNFPPDAVSCSYGALWNAFKIITEGHSDNEKDRLFRGTAAGAYRLR
jgi:predicted TIM-barrel fold metal-dependent hydrolase